MKRKKSDTSTKNTKPKKAITKPGLPNNDPDQTPDREVWNTPKAGKNKRSKTDYATNPKLPGNDPDQTPEKEVENIPVAKKRSKKDIPKNKIGFRTSSGSKKSPKKSKRLKKAALMNL